MSSIKFVDGGGGLCVINIQFISLHVVVTSSNLQKLLHANLAILLWYINMFFDKYGSGKMDVNIHSFLAANSAHKYIFLSGSSLSFVVDRVTRLP